MNTREHMAVDLEGALRNKNLSWFRRDDGTTPTNGEAREWIKYQLSLGRKLWPMGECEGFSYETGCPGHPMLDTIKEPKGEGERA